MNNDKLSHWILAALFSWFVVYIFVGVLLLHHYLGADLSNVTAAIGLLTLFQLALTPTFYRFRRRNGESDGIPLGRQIAAVIYVFGGSLIIFFFVNRSGALRSDFAYFLFGIPIVLGVLSVGVLFWLDRRKASQR